MKSHSIPLMSKETKISRPEQDRDTTLTGLVKNNTVDSSKATLTHCSEECELYHSEKQLGVLFEVKHQPAPNPAIHRKADTPEHPWHVSTRRHVRDRSEQHFL